MSKLILSGDLSVFRIEMLVRILEAIKCDGELTIESLERGQVYLIQGRIVGAKTATNQGLPALCGLVGQRAGTFSVRTTTSDDIFKHPDLTAFADNQSLFRQVSAQLGQGRFATAASTAQAQSSVPPSAPAAQAPPSPQTPAPNPLSQTMARRPQPAGSGPLARVPEMTEKGKVTLKSIQTNYALRGVQVDGDTWKVLGKVDGVLTIYQIGEALGVLGDRLSRTIEELQREGYIRFRVHDPTLDAMKTQGKFRFGEYMVTKGIITEVQLEGALRRQQELARRGRYMWLGEILVEMNYARPSQVQEAVSVQKQMERAGG